MRTLLIGTVSLVALAGVASAADLPVKAPIAAPVVSCYNWTGFYVGGHVGGGWGRKAWTDLGDDASDNVDYNTSGFLGGGQAGWNYQFQPCNSVVLGIEGDLSLSGIRGSGVPPLEAEPTTFESRIRWLSTLTGRLGYAQNQWLLYVKGGAAFARDVHTMTEVSEGVTASQGIATTRTGWTVGAGVEYGFMPNWTVKLEYNYMDFGRRTFLFDALQDDPVSVRQTLHAVKLGVNWKFGWDAPVVAARY